MFTETSPLEYFSALVSKAMKDQGIAASDTAGFYISSLLASYVASRKLSDEAFAARFLKALGAEREVKNVLLKEIGDSSLFMTGFFHESFKRKVVDIDYYVGMGIMSYASLADSLHEKSRRATALASIYMELSDKFVEFMDVLNEISERSGIKTALDTLRLYERWLKTGSPRTKAILKELGIDPVRVPVKPMQ
ncbi:MAG: hypothetical protein HY890_07855 [Deltaproteobacteria bacterium]|nr:hypothetical protein [Deltaproteobacteria bacterium]